MKENNKGIAKRLFPYYLLSFLIVIVNVVINPPYRTIAPIKKNVIAIGVIITQPHFHYQNLMNFYFSTAFY